jgi:uncharacterized membrane protein
MEQFNNKTIDESEAGRAPRRYIELDLLRSLAIVLMVAYHTVFDLSVFYGWEIDVFSGGWWLFARITATLFLLLTGVSAAISYSRLKDTSASEQWMKHLRRFCQIGSAALLVTAATNFADPGSYVRFGILHLIAVSALLLPLLAPLRERTAIAGITLLMLGRIVPSMSFRNELLIPFGIRPPYFFTVDYFPLVPWFGVILIGFAIGHYFYVRTNHGEKFSFLHSHFSFSLWPGRHALLCYILHQPIVLALLWLMLGRPKF